ncbi:hypothetical protein OY671_005305 [Metschnikowia pulcherrima]|nr:hypothetical protein OY671_005305 [Metschnikowia pulcherrima]
MVSTIVHLSRHGEVHNPDGVLYGRIPGYHLSERGHEMARRVAAHLAGEPGPDGTSRPRADLTVVVASPSQRAQETATPAAEAFGLESGTDERLIEAANHFEGKTFGVGDGSSRHPQHWPYSWNPFRPSWGEPYVEQVARMRAAVADARDKAAGHEASLVSHQLPVWLTRSSFENRRLWHDPRKRECSLASLTSSHFEDDRSVGLHYTEPVADLLPGAATVSGAKRGQGASRDAVVTADSRARAARPLSVEARAAASPSRRRPVRRASTGAVVLAAALGLAACAQDSGASTDVVGQGFVSGDGSVRTWDADERGDVVALTGTDYEGEQVDTSAWLGDVVVLNTWYAACAPCRAEAPDLVALANDRADDGVQVLGINTTDEAGAAQAFQRRFDVPYPSIDDRSGEVVAALSGTVPLQAVPSTVVLDREGRVAARVIGLVEGSTLTASVDDVLAEG